MPLPRNGKNRSSTTFSMMTAPTLAQFGRLTALADTPNPSSPGIGSWGWSGTNSTSRPSWCSGWTALARGPLKELDEVLLSGSGAFLAPPDVKSPCRGGRPGTPCRCCPGEFYLAPIVETHLVKAEMNYFAAQLRHGSSPYPARARLFPRRIAALTFSLAVLALGCNSDDSEPFSIDGIWTGSVAEADAEMSLVLIKEGKNGIAGSAQVTVPPEGQVPGTVSGAWKGKDVDFTIHVDEVSLGGSIVFEGAFQSEDVMSGTVDSGILEGTFPSPCRGRGPDSIRSHPSSPCQQL